MDNPASPVVPESFREWWYNGERLFPFAKSVLTLPDIVHITVPSNSIL